jgi:hypothetical protein
VSWSFLRAQGAQGVSVLTTALGAHRSVLVQVDLWRERRARVLPQRWLEFRLQHCSRGTGQQRSLRADSPGDSSAKNVLACL